ncbi:MAG: hypothetical protein AAGD14_10320 [Planctomycetota bacterium]
MTKLIQSRTDRGLRGSKLLVDRLLDGEEISIGFETETECAAFRAEARRLGVIVR